MDVTDSGITLALQPINNLLSYFKTSCISNLGMNERIEEWLKEIGML